MTLPPPRQQVRDSAADKQNSKLFGMSDRSLQLNYDKAYSCPVCRLGQISNLALMEAFACDLCHNIFEANLEKQQLRMVSRQPALIWRWNGRNWIEARTEGMEFGWGYLLAAIMLVALPTSLIGLTIYIFPPTPDTPLYWIPYVWTGLTFLSHLGIIIWLALEFYQLPIGIYLRAIGRRLSR